MMVVRRARALYTRKIYCETFEVAVSSGAQVELSALAKQLSTSIFHSVHSLTESMNLYGSLLPVVQETINAYDAATRVESSSEEAIVGPLIGRLRAHERDILVALAVMHQKRPSKYLEECVKLNDWMVHMRFHEASPSGIADAIRALKPVLDGLSSNKSVKYRENSGLPMKFSANAFGLLLDLVVDRLYGTTDDDAAGAARMKRLDDAGAPFTGAHQSAALRYAACIKEIHEQNFDPQSAFILREGQEINSVPPVLPLAIQSGAPSGAPLPVGMHWNAQRNWVTGLEVKEALEKVVPTADPDEVEVDDEEDGEEESPLMMIRFTRS